MHQQTRQDTDHARASESQTPSLLGELRVCRLAAQRILFSESGRRSRMAGVRIQPEIARRAIFPLFRNKDATLTHDCCGWVTTDGLPALSYVWQSVLYKETVYEVSRLVILDAKGTSSSGRMWHFLGRDGEYAGYNDYRSLESKDAALLDKVLDGVCIRSLTRQPNAN